MEKEFVPYEQALTLKELGFDEPCFGYYVRNTFIKWNDTSTNPKKCINSVLKTHNPTWLGEPVYDEKCSAPTFSQAFRWFREKYSLSGNIDCCDKLCEWNIKSSKLDKNIFSNKIQSHEEAELECLKELIEIAKNK